MKHHKNALNMTSLWPNSIAIHVKILAPPPSPLRLKWQAHHQDALCLVCSKQTLAAQKSVAHITWIQ